MAKELVRGTGQSVAVKSSVAIKKQAKKAAKHAAKKHAAKKHAKKAAKHAGETARHDKSVASPQRLDGSRSLEGDLYRAFHHLQRASAVISLIEAESGGDLKVLLARGVELYREATESGRKQAASAAFGLLSAAEHLSMAGLYAVRGVPSSGIGESSPDEIEKLGRSIGKRMVKVDSGSKYGLRLHALVFELVKRAEAAEHDPHLAWELVHGADGICMALEAGVV